MGCGQSLSKEELEARKRSKDIGESSCYPKISETEKMCYVAKLT